MKLAMKVAVLLGAGLFVGLLYWKSDRIFGPFFFSEPERVASCDEGRVIHFWEGTVGGELGSRLDAIGDLDGDGRPELAIGAPEKIGGGHLLIVSSSTGQTIHDLPPDGAWCFGTSMADAGDVDGDGIADFAVGSSAEGRVGPGQVRIYSGAKGTVLRTYEGRFDIDHYGFAVANVGDLDGDGHVDLLIGAPGSWKKENAGFAEVRSGKSGDQLFDLSGSQQKGDRFGFVVAAAGELDADGVPDFVVVSLGDGPEAHAGRLYLYSGKSGEEIRRIDGDRAWQELGHDVVSLGDIDGDDVPDLLVGAFAQHELSLVRLYSGRSGRRIYEVQGRHLKDAFGHTISAVGDLDQDGAMDFAVGLPDRTVDGIRRVGSVQLHSGKDGRRLFELLGCRELEHFGYALAPAGDVNGDGFADLAIGARVVEGPGRAVIISGAQDSPVK